MAKRDEVSRSARGVRRPIFRPWVWLASALLLHLTAGTSTAQVLPLKGPAEIVGPCESAGTLPGVPLAPAPPNPTVDSLVATGSRASILGELDQAREAFESAASLDRMNPVVAYRLARTLDDQGEAMLAIGEYCRFLSLSTSPSEESEVRERIRNLATAAAGRPSDPWTMAMQQGVEAYYAQQFREAIQAFTRAIELAPDDPRGYYNRGITYHSDGRGDLAVYDLEAYLARDPMASDRAVVAREVASMRAMAGLPPVDRPGPRVTPPGVVLAQGLVIPGLSQHATGRTGLGALVLSAVAGSIYFGMREGVVTRRETGVDPFGNPYEYDVQTVGRPNRALGFGAAAAIAIVGAIEGYLFAARQQRSNMAASPAPSPSLPATPQCPIRSADSLATKGIDLRRPRPSFACPFALVSSPSERLTP